MTSWRFSKWRPSVTLDLVYGNGSPPTKCLWWYLLYTQISVWSEWQFWRWCDFHILVFWLETAYSRHLLGGFGGMFSPNGVIYRSNPRKALRCAEIRRLSHKAWKSDQRFDPGAGSRKKDRHDNKKVTKALYFTYLVRSLHWADLHRNLHSSCRPRRNHACKLLNWNLSGLKFCGGRISHIPIDFCVGLITTVQR